MLGIASDFLSFYFPFQILQFDFFYVKRYSFEMHGYWYIKLCVGFSYIFNNFKENYNFGWKMNMYLFA